MPRRRRLNPDGVPSHIVQRGHTGQPSFFAEEHYRAYLNWLGEALKREGARLHAYALMTNHHHALYAPAAHVADGTERCPHRHRPGTGAICSTTPARAAAISP